jgi:phosphoserine aminotransferase
VFTYIPELTELSVDRDADYFFICSNNTIHGTRYASLPETGSVPLVADMSSSLLSEVIDVSRYGLIFAGAQKNIGPAGVTIVIIREDLVGHADDSIPTMMNYATHVENDSMFNTPPTYGIYIAGLVFQWLKEKGGLSAMEEINKKKAAILYDFLDESKLFRATVEKKDRSLMNVPFVSPTKELDEAFIKGAEGEGLMTLKGHRLAGGMRASIYNAMPVEGVEKLVAFMKKFEAENS